MILFTIRLIISSQKGILMFTLIQLDKQRIAYAISSSVILAFGLFNIHAQSQISEGGILGLTLLGEHWLSISPSITSMILNLLCYGLAWKEMGNKFIFYSLISIISYSISYALFESIGPLFPWIASYPLVASVLGALFVGFGVGLAMRSGAAPGGDDALALLIQKYLHIEIRWAYLSTDLIVLALSLSYIPFTRIIYSLLTVFISGQLIDYVMNIQKKHGS